ncbi:MAG: hypothetical protein KatS3mg108_3823 [Isosphaeraceae bacterium]|jgi:hypothetical protein|nr:MAG: hypothetical protein KatS3mg108_3823 [Isosphaeraceae bacterium]
MTRKDSGATGPTRRRLLGGMVSAWVSAHLPVARAAGGRTDPAVILPLHQIVPAYQGQVAEVIQSPSFHRRGAPDTFPANPRIYLKLVNEPVLTLALWKDLAASPAELHPIGPDSYAGSDGVGTTAVWHYLIRSPQIHVLFCNMQYAAPKGGPRLEGRLVLIVRSSYWKEQTGEPWIRHEVEVFAKVDSRGWRAVAATLRPIVERVLREQVDEAGLFVSLMARLVEIYPDWATAVARAQPELPASSRREFIEIVAETRRPGALGGRPIVRNDPGARRAAVISR